MATNLSCRSRLRVNRTFLGGLAEVRLSPDCDRSSDLPGGRSVPILLQKSLAMLLNNDSVALMRFAVEAIDDGATQSRSG